MEGLIFLGAIIFLAILAYVAMEFRRIAALKGHNEIRYFWWTFLLGPVGMLMVVALPDRCQAPPPVKNEEKSLESELPEI